MMIDINDHSTVMLIIDPEDGRIKDANGAALDFYEYSYNELVGMPISDINLLSDEEVGIEMDQAVKEERKFLPLSTSWPMGLFGMLRSIHPLYLLMARPVFCQSFMTLQIRFLLRRERLRTGSLYFS